MDGPVLSDSFWLSMLGSPVLDLSASSFVDAPSDEQGVENEVRLGLALHPGWDELHLVLQSHALAESCEASMNHEDAEGRPTELERLSPDQEGEPRGGFQFQSAALLELPGVELPALLVERGSQNPAPWEGHVVTEPEVSRRGVGHQGARWTSVPATTVSFTCAASNSFTGASTGSTENATKSASIPGFSRPRSFSANAA